MDTCEYIKALHQVRNECEHPPSWVRITTITMMAKNAAGNLDIREFRKNWKPVKIRPVGSKAYFEWNIIKSKKGTNFYNSVSIGYRDQYSVKHVKLFTNGSIHITGCSNIPDCKRVVAQLGLIIPGVTYDMFRIVMINTNFTLNHVLNLYTILRHFATLPGFDVSYDPGSYAAVKMKFKPGPDMKRITTNIFSTGSVIITGAQRLDEVVEAYRFINANIPDGARVKESEEKRDFNIFMGYTFEDWIDKLNIEC